MFKATIAFALISLPLAGTACTATDLVEDELAGDLPSDGEAGKADGADTFTYFSITRDFRKCAAPMCGGYWVKRVNKDETVCHNGHKEASCYMAELDDAALGLGEAELGAFHAAIENGGAVVRGDIVKRKFAGVGTFGAFVPTEAWKSGAASGAPDGVWVRVEQSGVRCIAAPCEDKNELKLNSTRSAMIADLDFEPSGATEEEIGTAFDALTTEGGGLIVVGDRYIVSEDGRTGRARTVTQFFTKIVPGATEGTCYVGGCSSQVCSDQEGVITTCEWREEYACYQTATCERQADGACGWTQTDELAACLAAN